MNTNTATTRSTPRRRRSTVVFCDEDDLVQIHEFDMVGEFERRHIWWTSSDFTRFRLVCHKTIRVLRPATADRTSSTNTNTRSTNTTSSNKNNDHQEQQQQHQKELFHSLRGLERWGAKECRERRELVQKALAVVLDSQNYNDGFVSAKAYMEATFQERIHAQAQGAQDEEAVLWDRMLEDHEEAVPCPSSASPEDVVDADDEDDEKILRHYKNVVTPNHHKTRSSSSKKPRANRRSLPLVARCKGDNAKSSLAPFGISIKSFSLVSRGA